MTKLVLCAMLAMVLIAIGPVSVMADRDDDDHHVTVINSYGATPFVYGGYSYVPLRGTTEFLGAALLWDSLRNRATITYHGRELGLVIGSTTAYYGGRPISLPVAPIVVGERLLVPTMVFDRYLDVPVRWDDKDDRVLILGPPGWGYYHVLRHPPAYVVQIMKGHGPPPWAPAHGRRRHRDPFYRAGRYVPTPFVHLGTTYIPLRDLADFVGAALLWDSIRNRAVITYSGREMGLVIGSPTVLYGGQTIVLQAAPIVVDNRVFVPAELVKRHMSIPVERSDGLLRIKGKKGWKDFRVSPEPPRHISQQGDEPRKGKGGRGGKFKAKDQGEDDD